MTAIITICRFLASAFLIWLIVGVLGLGSAEETNGDIRTRTQVDSDTGVQFSLKKQFIQKMDYANDRWVPQETDPCGVFGASLIVLGEVPKKIDLSDDRVAKAIVEKGKAYALQCKRVDFEVRLYQSPFDAANWTKVWVVQGAYFISDGREWYYENKAAALKAFEEFVKKNRVHEWPAAGSFSANPFVYDQKTVGIHCNFELMLSATEGLFKWRGTTINSTLFVVSGIPKGLFTAPGECVIAGKVTGRTEVPLPLLGIRSVPRLSFVGAYTCKRSNCADIALPSVK